MKDWLDAIGQPHVFWNYFIHGGIVVAFIIAICGTKFAESTAAKVVTWVAVLGMFAAFILYLVFVALKSSAVI